MSRIATVVGSKCGSIGPAPVAGGVLSDAAAAAVEASTAAWEAVAPHRALEATWSLIRATNAYLEANEPWKAQPGPDVDAVLGDAIEALRIIAVLVSPAVPATAQRIWERLGLPGSVSDQRIPGDTLWGGYPGGLAVAKGEPLFPRIKP
jgi:methionyl-tRNA synthetase